MECSEDTDETQVHCLGEYWPKAEGYKSMEILQTGAYGEDFGDILFQEFTNGDDAMYLAIGPVFLGDELRYVVCLEYDWSTFAYILNKNFTSIALWGSVSLLVVNALLILFI